MQPPAQFSVRGPDGVEVKHVAPSKALAAKGQIVPAVLLDKKECRDGQHFRAHWQELAYQISLRRNQQQIEAAAPCHLQKVGNLGASDRLITHGRKTACQRNNTHVMVVKYGDAQVP
jgi:hypothetical protein